MRTGSPPTALQSSACIADSLEVDAAMLFNDFAKERKVAVDSDGHRLGIAFPAPGATFDIGEEESDRAGRERGHRGLQAKQPFVSRGAIFARFSTRNITNEVQCL
jgi:hypothetical protein